MARKRKTRESCHVPIRKSLVCHNIDFILIERYLLNNFSGETIKFAYFLKFCIFQKDIQAARGSEISLETER